jgi:hypothetical protein
MIHSETLRSLTEEELSILYYICGHPKILGSMVQPKLEFIKMFKLDVLMKLIEIFKQHALEEKKSIFDELSKKLSTNN